MGNRRRNNASWCCDQIAEKINDYKLTLKELDKITMPVGAKEEVKRQLEIVINDLENILYG